jgi:hypothetical protein
MDSPPDPLRFVKSVYGYALEMVMCSRNDAHTSALYHKVLDRPVHDAVLVIQWAVRERGQAHFSCTESAEAEMC